MEAIPPWPRPTRSYYVILRWDTDRPAVYLGHRFNWWRFAIGGHPKAKFRRIPIDDPQVHRFITEESARAQLEMPDLVRQKNWLSIAELRDL